MGYHRVERVRRCTQDCGRNRWRCGRAAARKRALDGAVFDSEHHA
jgi:hypothetical protein